MYIHIHIYTHILLYCQTVKTTMIREVPVPNSEGAIKARDKSESPVGIMPLYKVDF